MLRQFISKGNDFSLSIINLVIITLINHFNTKYSIPFSHNINWFNNLGLIYWACKYGSYTGFDLHLWTWSHWLLRNLKFSEIEFKLRIYIYRYCKCCRLVNGPIFQDIWNRVSTILLVRYFVRGGYSSFPRFPHVHGSQIVGQHSLV